MPTPFNFCNEFSILRSLYNETTDGKLNNLFKAKIINKTNKDVSVNLKLEGINGEIKLIGAKEMTLKKEYVNEFTFFIEIPKSEILKRNTAIKVGVYHNNDKIQTVKTNFLGPFK